MEAFHERGTKLGKAQIHDKHFFVLLETLGKMLRLSGGHSGRDDRIRLDSRLQEWLAAD